MFVLVLLVASASLVWQGADAASDCGVCELNGSYSPSNGYGCFIASNERVICTCPDRRYVVERRCRICDRPNICGNHPNNTCSELSPTSLGGQSNNSYTFACFCSDDSFVLGQACPPVPTMSTTSTTTSAPAITTTTTTNPPAITTTTTTTTTSAFTTTTTTIASG